MPLTVLVIDDDPALRTLVCLQLKTLDCVPHEAVDGLDAEARLSEVKPDIIFLDIMMPMQDGYVTCANLRKLGYAGKIIMLSALDPEAGRARSLEAGADDYAQKPVTRALLRIHISAVQAEHSTSN